MKHYDKLLEKTEIIRGKRLKVLTNKQLVEIPTIMQLKSRNYIFKAHGDIDDVDSIILTKEDYAKLYSEQSEITTTLKALFLSRTIVFMGFGLFDPDFEYIRNTISNTYKKNQMVHYAVMPDIENEEKEYWRKNYGIRILSYQTKENEDGTRNHDELEYILDRLYKILDLRRMALKSKNDTEY